MVQYLATFRNEGGAGPVAQLFSSDEAGTIRDFVAKYDKPGFAVYRCVSPLEDGARRRRLKTVKEITQFCVDVDVLKDLAVDVTAAETRLLHLPLQPTVVRYSGGGFHIVFRLKEPISRTDPEFAYACELLKRLTGCLSGDPAPAHPAALLREEGTHNTKRGTPVRVEAAWGSGEPVDISEIEALVDLLPEEGIFPRKPTPNGGAGAHTTSSDEPVDVEAQFASIHDGASANAAHCHIIPSLLRRGDHPSDVLERVVAATMEHAGTALGWTREREVKEVRKRILSGYRLLLKDYDIADGVPEWLPGEFHADWLERLIAGRRPMVHYNRGGFCVRAKQEARPEDEPGAQRDNEPPPEDDGAPHQDKPRERLRAKRAPTEFRLRPLEVFDVHSLPARPWLYGRHYQRRKVSITGGPGGTGKTSLKMVERVAMAVAANLLSDQPEERLRVWYHCGEDDMAELRLRLAAICVHYGLDLSEVLTNFYMTSGDEFPLRVARGHKELHVDDALLERIAAEIGAHGIDVAMLDPLVTLHSVSEQDNGKMDQVIRLFYDVATYCNCSIGLAQHVRKLRPRRHRV